MELSKVSATWVHLHTPDGCSSNSPTSLLTQHSPLSWSHQGAALDGHCLASWTGAWDLL